MRIIQFGLERGLEAGSTRRKRSWRYKAPEQVKGEAPEPRTDVYAAAAIAYHAFSGRRPFRGRDIKKKVLSGEPTKLTKLRGELPPKLEEYVFRGMALSAEDRWDDAEAMAEAIDDLPGMASHREVSDWLHDVCEARLQHSEALKRAVENAPVMLSADELEGPLSVSNAPRESLAEIKLPPGIFDEVENEAEAPPTAAEEEKAKPAPKPEVSTKPTVEATPDEPPVSETTPQQGTRTIVIAVAAAAASAALVLLLTRGDGKDTAPPRTTPTPAAVVSNQPPPQPVKEAMAPPSANTSVPAPTPTTTPSAEASSPEPAVATPPPVAAPSGKWPPAAPSQPTPEPSAKPEPVPTVAPTGTYRLPDDI